jgi:Zn-dependent alcohol dehydrogenase
LLFAQVQEIGKQVDYIGDKVVVFLRVCFQCRDCPVSPRFIIHCDYPLKVNGSGAKTLFREIEFMTGEFSAKYDCTHIKP